MSHIHSWMPLVKNCKIAPCLKCVFLPLLFDLVHCIFEDIYIVYFVAVSQCPQRPLLTTVFRQNAAGDWVWVKGCQYSLTLAMRTRDPPIIQVEIPSEKLCNKSHQESSQNASCCEVATLQSSQNASCCEVATLQSSQNASCYEVATLQSSQNASCCEVEPYSPARMPPATRRLPYSPARMPPAARWLTYNPARMPPATRQLPWEACPQCILTCLILVAYSSFLTGNKICSYALPVVLSFCLCVCHGFSEMSRGLFHKQGDGRFTSERT